MLSVPAGRPEMPTVYVPWQSLPYHLRWSPAWQQCASLRKLHFRHPKTIRGPVDSDRWVLPLQDGARLADPDGCHLEPRSEEHTSELQSLMRISYAVFCLKKKKQINNYTTAPKHQRRTHNNQP